MSIEARQTNVIVDVRITDSDNCFILSAYQSFSTLWSVILDFGNTICYSSQVWRCNMNCIHRTAIKRHRLHFGFSSISNHD
jgi:hypothetical protein